MGFMGRCGKIINYLRLNCYTRPLETIKLINELYCVWVKEGIVRLVELSNLKIKSQTLETFCYFEICCGVTF